MLFDNKSNNSIPKNKIFTFANTALQPFPFQPQNTPNMRKRWTLQPADEAVVSHLRQALKIHPVFCRLLAQRGISTFDEARTFFP